MDTNIDEMTGPNGMTAVMLENLRQRYAAERDKRLRKEGVEQYIAAKGDFSYFVEDPYVEPVERAPIERSVDALIVGAGFGGILTAAELKKIGVEDVLMVEKGGGFGGTWYWNRYPGLACDMKSYVYLPLLEETGYMPPRNYASGKEIREHAERIVNHFGLNDKGLFQTEITEMRWSEAEACWIVSTVQGDRIRAKYVITATGVFSRPKLPGIKGIDSYEGHTFHTSRWDYGYTGGSSEGGLTGLKGKRVALVGTGATAVQVAPMLAEYADHVFLIQRTPSGVDHREEKPTDEDWVKSLEPGWQKKLIDNFTALTSGAGAEEDLIKDGWTFLFTTIGSMDAGTSGGAMSLDEMMLAAEFADAEKMNEIRARIDVVVRDPDVAAALKPWYRRFCKRPVFHDGYLEMFNRDNVTLLDTDGKGVEEITKDSIVVNGEAHQVDCIIFASGFEVGADAVLRNGFKIVGKDGVSLSDKWAEEGISTYHGVMTNGFPNLFLHQTAQGALAANFCHGLAEAAKHIAYLLNSVETSGGKSIEVTEAAEKEWVAHCAAVSGLAMDFLEVCTPGYYNVEGKIDAEAMKGYGYGLGPIVYFNIIKSWRDAGDLAGMEIAKSEG